MRPFSIRVYVEGGGPARGGDLAGDCRKAFRALLEKVTGRKVMIIACGSRNDAYKAFATAVKDKSKLPILLVDSEEIVLQKDAWAHLQRRDCWVPLEAPAHLMAVCMEAWLVADRNALLEHFGNRFNAAKLPEWPKLWEVDKSTLYRALKDATKDRRNTDAYDKGRDSFKVLARVDPTKLRCPHARRFFDELKRTISASEVMES